MSGGPKRRALVSSLQRKDERRDDERDRGVGDVENIEPLGDDGNLRPNMSADSLALGGVTILFLPLPTRSNSM